jgi:hypothetical protein
LYAPKQIIFYLIYFLKLKQAVMKNRMFLLAALMIVVSISAIAQSNYCSIVMDSSSSVGHYKANPEDNLTCYNRPI